MWRRTCRIRHSLCGWRSRLREGLCALCDGVNMGPVHDCTAALYPCGLKKVVPPQRHERTAHESNAHSLVECG